MSTNTTNPDKRSEGPLIDIPEDKFDGGFDLAEMLSKRSDTPDHERKRCPNPDCGSLSVCPRQPQKQPENGDPSRGRYYCQKCRTFFDEPKIGGESA